MQPPILDDFITDSNIVDRHRKLEKKNSKPLYHEVKVQSEIDAQSFGELIFTDDSNNLK